MIENEIRASEEEVKKLRELLRLQMDKKSALDDQLQKFAQIQQSIANCQTNLIRQKTVGVGSVVECSGTSSRRRVCRSVWREVKKS